jgi:3-carboxy-cis,cis-muconate cycloisomerase
MSVRLVDTLAPTELLADVFSDTAFLAAMLRFEVALARVEARAGVIPEAAAVAIARAAVPDGFDCAAIARVARESGTMVVPFVDALLARVSAIDPAAATFVHWGATSQDVADTALTLCLSRARPILESDHHQLLRTLRSLSDQHANTVMLGRTLMQPAPPITFGLKVAGWFGGVSRAGASVMDALTRGLVVQFGGAAGTLAALGDRGLDVTRELARELELGEPTAPWHAHRDVLAAIVAACGVYCGALGKIARDITLLMQPEVAEASEPGGRSSTMPHKRNPANCSIAIAAAVRVPGMVASFLSGMLHEHERGLGWQGEASTIACVVQSTGAAVAAVRGAVGALRVDPARMRANIAATGDVVFAERAMMALAPAVGRESARQLIAEALDKARTNEQSFASALAAAARAAGAELPRELSDLASPEAYLGVADTLRRRLLGDTE